MPIPELIQAAFFYLVFSSFAFIGLPLTKKVFKNGAVAYAAAKLFGFMIIGYGIWIASSLRLIDYQNGWIVAGVWVIAVILGIFIDKKLSPRDQPAVGIEAKTHTFWHRSKDILLIEAITVAAYSVYLVARSQNPAIEGGEHFMDMAFLGASGKTHYFPFIDPWYAGKTVNYYYYGFYLVSLTSNLAHVSYSIAYNLAIGLIYSQSFLFSGIIAYFLTRSKKLSLLTALLITTFGALFFAACPFRIAAEGNRVCNYNAAAQYFNPPYISNEIPSFAFTTANLHPHLIALPFFLCALALIYAASQKPKPDKTISLLFALNIATCALINAWDFVTLSSLSLVFLLIIFLKISKSGKSSGDNLRAIGKWSLFAAMTFGMAVILILPMLITFDVPTAGLGLAYSHIKEYGLQNVQWPTPIEAEIGIWGELLAIVLTALFIERKRILPRHNFIAAIAITSAVIIVGVEIFFVKDIYSVTIPSLFRYNTVFKFGFHAWVLLSLAFIWGMKILYSHDFGTKTGLARRGLNAIIAVTVIGGAFYPYQALVSYPKSVAKGLNGAQWIEKTSEGDWNAINYINTHIPERAVIAEASGDSYSIHGRISAFTGMIAPIGWMSHEAVWRIKKEDLADKSTSQNIFAEVNGIGNDMRSLYETSDIQAAKNIIDKYKIEYVFVGKLEKDDYPILDEKKFYSLGKPVFSSPNSNLFKIDAVVP
jgi:uncharacterized membrane protein